MLIQIEAALASARSAANLQGLTLRTPAIRAISRQQLQEVKHADKADVFTYCEQLLATKDNGARVICESGSGKVFSSLPCRKSGGQNPILTITAIQDED